MDSASSVSRRDQERYVKGTNRHCSRSLISAAVSDMFPAKSANEATVRLLFENREKEPLTVYTDGLRA